MEYCNLCGNSKETLLGRKIVPCPCQEFTVIDEWGDECSLFERSAYKAALKFAREYNEEDGEYALMNSTLEIKVDGVPYIISAEPDVYYSAKKVNAGAG